MAAIWEFLKHGIEALNVGIEAKHGYLHLVEHFKERLRDDKLPANGELRLAVEESLLEAARAFALGVNEQLDPKPTLLQAVGSYLNDLDSRRPILERLKVSGSDWVKELLEESNRAHGKHGIAAEFILDENEVTTLLLNKAPEEFEKRVTAAFADWLNRRVQNAAKPSCVDGFLANGWPLEKDGQKRITFYEAFALFFREQLKTKEKVFKILVAETLADMRRDMKAMREDVKWLRAAKADLNPAQFAGLKQIVESLQPTFEQFQKWLDERLARIEGLLIEIKADVGEVKATTHRIESKLDDALNVKRDIPRTHNLRTPVPLFGRDKDLEVLLDGITRQRTASVAISGVHGLGGVGKTELALTLAQRLAPQFPDAQIMLDLRGFDPDKRAPLAVEEVLSQIILAFHPQARLPDDLANLQELYRTVLAQAGRVLLLFDNAFSAAQLMAAVPPPNCLLLTTSRNHFVLPGLPMVTRDLNSLLPAQSQAMLLDRASRLGDQAAHAAKLCGHLPLPLRTFADTVAGNRVIPVADLIARLEAHAADLTPQDAAFQTSYDLLPDPLPARWLALGVFVGDFDLHAAQAVWDESSRETALAAMQSLVDASLVEFDEGKGRFRLHDLVREFCLKKLDAAVLDSARLAHARHYCEVLRETNELYLKGRDSVLRGLSLFDTESANIQTGQAFAATHWVEFDIACKVCTSYGIVAKHILRLRLHLRRQLEWLEAALLCAQRTGDRNGQAEAVGEMGVSHKNLGDAKTAIPLLEQQLVICRELGNRNGQGVALVNLGSAYSNLGDARKAIKLYEQALVVMREIGDRRGEGANLGNLGLAHAALGDARKAIEFYEQHLNITREIGDRRGEGNALGNLGVAHKNLGDVSKAIEFYEQALVIDREIGDRRGEGNDLWNSALAHDSLGNRAEAVPRAEAALRIFEAIEHPNATKVRAKLAEWRGQA